MAACQCSGVHEPRLVVLTGGPGAGKTATLEMIKHEFCDHVRVVPEAASVVFGGGFPRIASPGARVAAQRAIYFVQREMEAALRSQGPAILLCDRGTVDGVAYWPGPGDLWSSVGTTRAEEMTRYHAVIHLRTPSAEGGYNRANPLRTESAAEAAVLDARIVEAWEGHPHRIIVPNATEFPVKAARCVGIDRDGAAPLLPAAPGRITTDGVAQLDAQGSGGSRRANGRAARGAFGRGDLAGVRRRAVARGATSTRMSAGTATAAASSSRCAWNQSSRWWPSWRPRCSYNSYARR